MDAEAYWRVRAKDFCGDTQPKTSKLLGTHDSLSHTHSVRKPRTRGGTAHKQGRDPTTSATTEPQQLKKENPNPTIVWWGFTTHKYNRIPF